MIMVWDQIAVQVSSLIALIWTAYQEWRHHSDKQQISGFLPTLSQSNIKKSTSN